MRYIGNKTRLLPFIAHTLSRHGVTGGTAVDPFSGTASVARMLKRRGFRVVAGDLMAYGYVFARAYVQTAREPDVSTLARNLGLRTHTLCAVISLLDGMPPAPGFIHDHYAPAGDGGRMYFTPENAARIDAIRETIDDWRRDGLLDDDAFHLLLTSLIEAADRVANTTGVYAAWVKTWQPNAQRPVQLRVPPIVAGNGGRAVRGDALDIVRGAGTFDLLYLSPRAGPAAPSARAARPVSWMMTPSGATGPAPAAAKRPSGPSSRTRTVATS
jgi:adenine-specific DNA-methyltransferase